MNDLERLENAKSTFKEIMKVHMREPFDENELQMVFGNMKKLKAKGCQVFYTDDISKAAEGTEVAVEDWLKCLKDGYCVLTAPQLGIRILYVKVYGGKGMLWGKKIHYAAYQQDYDEKTWTPLGTFKMWMLAVTGLNNIFRSEGLLSGPAL